MAKAIFCPPDHEKLLSEQLGIVKASFEDRCRRTQESKAFEALNSIVQEEYESERPPSRKVFIVHGHDEAPREKVARFLEKLDFEPIILHERASGGRTVIEKIEAHGEVGFAIVLLTPDDEGCQKGEIPKSRARQNVVLELGYFLGRLKRNRVCALKVGEDLEIPSDFGGVVYVTFDRSDGWKQELGKELQHAGFAIDWNKVIGQPL